MFFCSVKNRFEYGFQKRRIKRFSTNQCYDTEKTYIRRDRRVQHYFKRYWCRNVTVGYYVVDKRHNKLLDEKTNDALHRKRRAGIDRGTDGYGNIIYDHVGNSRSFDVFKNIHCLKLLHARNARFLFVVMNEILFIYSLDVQTNQQVLQIK